MWTVLPERILGCLSAERTRHAALEELFPSFCETCLRLADKLYREAFLRTVCCVLAPIAFTHPHPLL